MDSKKTKIFGKATPRGAYLNIFFQKGTALRAARWENKKCIDLRLGDAHCLWWNKYRSSEALSCKENQTFMEAFMDWFMSLGEKYNVNPIIFGSIYLGAIPFFSASLAWLVKNLRQKKSIALPALSSGFFFISAYLYLVVVGKNVPLWVYGFIIALVAFGAWSTLNKVKNKVEEKPTQS